jgi:hypothetical protein
MSNFSTNRRADTRRTASERAEGVISTAIAVLVIAFLGVAMWVGFKSIFDGAAKNTSDQVEMIGK